MKSKQTRRTTLLLIGVVLAASQAWPVSISSEAQKQGVPVVQISGLPEVRDLFGTVMNEGANRGILITTSSYGPDSYAFAKDKPISLVDGPNLLVMLRRHGKKFRIDLEEARRLNQESGNDM